MANSILGRQDCRTGPDVAITLAIIDQQRVGRRMLALPDDDKRRQAFARCGATHRPVRRLRRRRLQVGGGKRERRRRRRGLAKRESMLAVGFGLTGEIDLAGGGIRCRLGDEDGLVDQALFRHVEVDDVASLDADPFRSGRPCERARLSAVDDVVGRQLAWLRCLLSREDLHQWIIDFLGARATVGSHIVGDADRRAGDDGPVAVFVNIAGDDAVEALPPGLGDVQLQLVQQMSALDRRDRGARSRDKASDHAARFRRSRAAGLKNALESRPLCIGRPLDAADLPVIGFADVGALDEFGDADMGDRRSYAAGALAVLPAAERPCEGVQTGVVGPDIGGFVKRPTRPRTAGIGAVETRVVDLGPLADPGGLWRACAIKLPFLVEAQAPHRMRDARQLVLVRPARGGAAAQ